MKTFSIRRPILRKLPLLALALINLAHAAPAQGSKTGSAPEAAAKLRSMFFARDFEGGYIEGQRLAQQYPDALDVKVWFILNASRTEEADEALKLAEKWTASDEKNGWAWFALAGALNYNDRRNKEALAASEKVLALLPGNGDAIWLQALILRRQNMLDETLNFIEQNQAKVERPAELLIIKAAAFYAKYLGEQKRDEAKLKASLDAFGDALKADSDNVNALYLQANYLRGQKRIAEAHALLKKALALAPDSTPVHTEYWIVVGAMPALSDEAKEKEIEADIKVLLQNRGRYAATLLTVARQFDELKLNDKKREIEDRILQVAPISREAEWVLIGRIRQLASEGYEKKDERDPAKPEAYQKMLREYVNRPRHFDEGLLGEAYRNLFYLINADTATSNAELLAIAKRMIQYEKMNLRATYPIAAIALAERKTSFREAEAIAREGIAEVMKQIESERDSYKTDAEYEGTLNMMTSAMYDALGWVFFNEGRMQEAEKELLHSHSLMAGDLINLYHLGQFYQAKKDYAKAEEYYIKGSSVPTTGENRNAGALKALYELRNGSLKGFDKYWAKIEEADAVNRKARALGERIKEPAPVNAFKLKTLDGKVLASTDLKGKIVVINYWGIWCGWCVKEMPEFQKLHEKYKPDTEVVILSINNDSTPSDVPAWMQKNKYNFNVLFDDGYVDGKAGISGFPTTWFVDKEGRIAFIIEGWRPKLVEEYSWRIEALKASGQ